MADEIMVAVAAALAGKAAEALAEGARGAWDALVRLLRRRLGHDPAASAALAAAEAGQRDETAVQELAAALERIAAADADFAAQMRSLWPQAQAELSASGGGVINVSSGTVRGHLIQAGDLHVDGGLHLGDVHKPGES